MIQSLTEKQIESLKADWAGQQVLSEKSPGVELKKSTGSRTWSADYVKGKGEGLIFLLHGKPGVGKTYTAECISAHIKRPLLNLTATDLGTEPLVIEKNLAKWFKLAASWNAVLLIDEADIYMEHRSVQDIARNSLVAGFLRALEYFKGVLFLTTNRVGHFDEAFISRINMTIYYGPFNEHQRRELWESYFKKLEKEREEKMRIHLNTRDYVEESEDLRKLEWNGREIKNAFQIAVSLAEAEGDKDDRGRVIIKPDHIKATVEMSKSFKEYLNDLYAKNEEDRAAIRGNRYDAFGKRPADETAYR
ncbi:hypothetical protein DIS24_g8468 [Lasiodiplodia hormozganensis]|uniref:AAA+ ATPase domain-containing protein n=1 Tax=Lasiodiplodia hormozganensis TaxID=869390 RepID=A0AA39Y2Q8_9PEZI|nr:hypothetical protein DIS24_g8468 [Lasiodiplodia hormozganensis]